MRILVVCTVAVVVMGGVSQALAKSPDEYVADATTYQESGDLAKAIETMEEAVAQYPESVTANSYLGLFLGMAAGQTQDFMEAGSLVQRSFEMLDKAVSLDSLSPIARFHRGILGVEVPKFLGKLEPGIQDLEFLVELHRKSPVGVSNDKLVAAHRYLAEGYQKLGDMDRARLAWSKVVELAPGTRSAKRAEEIIAQMAAAEVEQAGAVEKEPEETPAIAALKEKLQETPDDISLLVELGKAYVEAGDYDNAETPLRKALGIDPTSVPAYKWLAFATQGLVEKGYDERIALDTSLRTNLAFELVRVLDQGVDLAPDDLELRLMRGAAGVYMPFFVGRLEQAIEDLNVVVAGDVPDSTKAEALYLLGVAHQKKTMTYWIEVATRHPGTAASQAVYDAMRPSLKRVDLSTYKAPLLAIDFFLGFRDELAPQTAVWVEDGQGEFVKTIYVSGFSGHAKGVQVNLPGWSESSHFVDVDGVTAASIDLGHHVYLWDLEDASGEQVPDGDYAVFVEVSYWPSMQYQLTSATVAVGGDGDLSVVEEGDLIPYLEARYLPETGK
jgi:tetratricopeptide (TPR) repeat protein